MQFSVEEANCSVCRSILDVREVLSPMILELSCVKCGYSCKIAVCIEFRGFKRDCVSDIAGDITSEYGQILDRIFGQEIEQDSS